jgi:NAD(P)-dependent dehydrogenase (short-subunit alcohol dehydrogenase family)
MSHSTPFHLTGRTVLVTGATAGLGRQTAISASQMGARVIVTGRNLERLEKTFSDLHGEGHLALPADLASGDDRTRLSEELPPLDGIAHCAGLTLLHPFKFIDEKRFHEIYTANVEAPLFLTQRLYKKKKLNRNGSIVFVSSIGSFVGTKGHTIYAGSKAAVIGMMRVLAHELVVSGIRANSVSPGMIRTEVVDGMSHQISSELMEADAARYPLGFGQADDVANAVIFFLSPASKWITGTNLIMDGGLT